MTITKTTITRPATPKPQGGSPTSSIPSHRPSFTAEQIEALTAPLDRAKVQTRSQAGRSLAYIEGWVVIAEANRIFGFDGWQRETIEVRCVAERERTLGARGPEASNRTGWGVTYTARVRITLNTTGPAAVIREGSGAGHGIDADLGQAHESALKEAETDAMKRALMTFGNPFGLALYDKRQRQVTSAAAPQESPDAHSSQARPNGSRPTNYTHAMAGAGGEPSAYTDTGYPPQPAPGLLPLDEATIRSLHSTIRRLPRPLLEALTKGFRKRFSIPEAAATIADRIVQKRHLDWVEAFLAQHQPRQAVLAKA
jgi:hypothetical protein